MSKQLSKAITAIIPAKTLELMAQEYKARKLKRPERRPDLQKVAEAVGIPRSKLEQIYGLVGDRESLHEYLGRATDLEVSLLDNLLTKALNEAENRIQTKMADRDLIALIKVIHELTSPQNPSPSTNIQINNGPQNIDQLLAQRRLNSVPVEDEEPQE